MKNKLIPALCALALGLSATTLARPADAATTEEVKAPMYSAKCHAPCSFSVKSHDRAEVVAVLKEHAKAHHDGLVLTDEKAEAMVKTSEPKK